MHRREDVLHVEVPELLDLLREKEVGCVILPPPKAWCPHQPRQNEMGEGGDEGDSRYP